VRVTVNLDADVLAGARSPARERGISIGAAQSDLARHGPRAPTTATGRRIPSSAATLDGPQITPDGPQITPDGPQITPEMIRAANGNC